MIMIGACGALDGVRSPYNVFSYPDISSDNCPIGGFGTKRQDTDPPTAGSKTHTPQIYSFSDNTKVEHL